MDDRIKFLLNRISERLWVKPLIMCLLSIGVVFLAKLADDFNIDRWAVDISRESLVNLLKIISTSMMVIATFAVASMVSAYASASRSATPRSFSLIVADDVSQNALSSFIGAFIYSIVALIALENGYFDKAGRFALFSMTLTALAIVILTFVRWVDRIARLGRMGQTIDKVEAATDVALQRRRRAPTLGAAPVSTDRARGRAIYANTIGYVQRVNLTALQKYAEHACVRISLAALPGTFSAPGRALAYVTADSGASLDIDARRIEKQFLIGDERIYDEDPRFGLVVLSEIASRALSPAVNDPGTAIDIIGTLVRLFARWSEPLDPGEERALVCDRIEVPELSLSDMFDDAFSPIARDGARIVEVAVRLQKAFDSLALAGDGRMLGVARQHARTALARAQAAMEFPDDLRQLRQTAQKLISGEKQPTPLSESIDPE